MATVLLPHSAFEITELFRLRREAPLGGGLLCRGSGGLRVTKRAVLPVAVEAALSGKHRSGHLRIIHAITPRVQHRWRFTTQPALPQLC